MIREIIEARAREAAMKIAKGYIHRDDHYPPRYSVDEIADEIAGELKHLAITILTDPQIGFKEALEWVVAESCPSDVSAAAEAKLAELKELEKRK